MDTRRYIFLAVFCCFALVGAGSVEAQQDQGQPQSSASGSGQDQSQGQSQSQGGATQPEQPQSPIPAVRAPLASLANGQDLTQPQAVTPDTRPLSGAQYLSLGGPAYSHSYWQPSLNVSFVGLSNPVIGGTGGGWNTYNSVAGEIDLHQISGISSFTLSEEGGGSFSNGNGSNSGVEAMALTEVLSFRRMSISLIDQLEYLPQAAFGYTSLGTIGTQTQTQITGTSGLQTGFVPNQSILTTPGQRISNVGLVEINYLLSPRSSITLVGSDGILHYFDNDLDDTNEVIGQIGYNYQWTRRDTIAILYTFDGFRYNNIDQSINSHSVQLSYARRMTGKLSFQLSGGPEYAISRLPLTTESSTVVVPAGSQTNQFLWTANAALTYALQRTSFQASYGHGVTGGSGVLAGAVSDNATGTLNRQLSRVSMLALSTGYSRNKGLTLTPETTTTTTSSQTYDYVFGGVNWTHTISHSLNVMLGYQLQYQYSNQAFCVTAPCSTSYTAHEVFLDLSFRPALIPF